jgi:hypothetical protein
MSEKSREGARKTRESGNGARRHRKRGVKRVWCGVCLGSLGEVASRRHIKARNRWLTPRILATQETQIRRIVVQSQPRQIYHKTLS